jgi:hypothetical protein
MGKVSMGGPVCVRISYLLRLVIFLSDPVAKLPWNQNVFSFDIDIF